MNQPTTAAFTRQDAQMPRLPLLAVMVTISAFVVLATGIAWLRRAPVPPTLLQTITKGMTIGHVERLIGQRLTSAKSCTGNHYYIVVPSSAGEGQDLALAITANRRRYDPLTKDIGTLAHEEEVCTRVSFHRWSKVAFVNRHEWLFRLLVGDDTDTTR